MATRTATGAAGVSILLNDPHGSATLAIANLSKAITVRRVDPFGNPRGTTPTSWPGDHGFLGKPTDTTGLTAVGARYLDTTLGRFISVDPVMDLADPQQWNAYSYANNNPTTYSDPTGLRPIGTYDRADTPRSVNTCSPSAPGPAVAPPVSAGNASSQPSASVSGGTAAWQGFLAWGAGAVDATTGLTGLVITSGNPIGLFFYQALPRIQGASPPAVPSLIPQIGNRYGSDYEASYFIGSILGPQILIGGPAGKIGNAAKIVPGAEVSGIVANQTAGNAVRDVIAASHPGSLIEQSFGTTAGVRRLDVLTQSAIGIESKVGRTSLTATTQSQIVKDTLLLKNGDVTGIEWVFSRSGVTGQIGPTGPLAAALNKAGIPWSLAP